MSFKSHTVLKFNHLGAGQSMYYFNSETYYLASKYGYVDREALVPSSDLALDEVLEPAKPNPQNLSDRMFTIVTALMMVVALYIGLANFPAERHHPSTIDRIEVI